MTDISQGKRTATEGQGEQHNVPTKRPCRSSKPQDGAGERASVMAEILNEDEEHSEHNESDSSDVDETLNELIKE